MITMWLKKKVQYTGFYKVQLDRVPDNVQGRNTFCTSNVVNRKGSNVQQKERST